MSRRCAALNSHGANALYYDQFGRISQTRYSETGLNEGERSSREAQWVFLLVESSVPRAVTPVLLALVLPRINAPPDVFRAADFFTEVPVGPQLMEYVLRPGLR